MVEEIVVKIRLSVGEPSVPMPGYIQVDPARPVEGLSVSDLSRLSEEGEASEILAVDVLDFFHPEHRHAILSHWVSRLNKGGVIVLGTQEMVEVARLFMISGDHEAFRTAMYGPSGRRRVSMGTLPELKHSLATLGLEIVKSYTRNNFSYVEAKRG
jgi:hypothetical protein